MTEGAPPKSGATPERLPDLLWECFTNWSDLLRRLEEGSVPAQGGSTDRPTGSVPSPRGPP
jgi:hypothetical protein